jgi:hypothetical protein
MATKNMALPKGVWVVVSGLDQISAANNNSVGVEVVWGDTDPAADFKPYVCPPGGAAIRVFETGALRMRNNSDSDVKITYDEA